MQWRVAFVCFVCFVCLVSINLDLLIVQLAAKFARRSDDTTVMDAKRRALERRKKRKGPVKMED